MKSAGSAAGHSSYLMTRKMFSRMLPPAMLSSVTLALANVADALVVGNRVGETGLATIGLVTPVYLVYSLLGIGFAGGGAITHARLTASGTQDQALAHFRFLSGLLLGIGAAIALLGNLFLEALLTGLGAGPENPALREMCAGYLRPLISAAPLFFLNFVLYYFSRNDDNPALASLGFSVSSILDLALNVVFVIVLDQGVRGAVRATLIAQAACAVILSLHLFSSRRGILRLKAVLAVKAERPRVRSLARTSLRTGFASSVSFLFQFVFMLMGNHLLLSAGLEGTDGGELSVAVFDLVLNCSFVMISAYQASSDAMQPLASTFSAEHDEASLRYLLRLSILSGLFPGLLAAVAIGGFAGPVSVFFGLAGGNALQTSVPALRIYLLSTPVAGLLTVLIAYDQSTGRVYMAALGTLLRNAVFLLPLTLVFGLFMPGEFWWVFLVTEVLCLLVLVPIRILDRRRSMRKVPSMSRTMTNDSRELGEIVAATEAFCEANGVPAATAVQLQLAVEELCAVTMLQAFSGKPDEYIRVTLAIESGPRYLLHIRNSAPFFNPLDMKMDRARKDMEAEIMDSIGVMMVQKKAKSLSYRNFRGYNVMTVEY